MNTQSKVKVLEGYHALDYAVFGKEHSSVEVCCPILKEEYVRAKGALLSCVIDLYKHIEYAPKAITESITASGIQSNAIATAKRARKEIKKNMVSESTKKIILSVIQESMSKSKTKKKSEVQSVIESEIKKIAFSKIVDDILIKNVMNESTVSNFKNSKGAVLLKAYKTLRENYIQSVITMLES